MNHITMWKFNRYPKNIISHKVREKSTPHRRILRSHLRSRQNSCSLPNINAAKNESETSANRPQSDGNERLHRKQRLLRRNQLTTINQADLSLAGNALSNQGASKDTVQTVQNIHGKNVILDHESHVCRYAIKGNYLTSSTNRQKNY